MSKKVDDGHPIDDYEYLIHHIEVEGGEEVIHHCLLLDHIANMFVHEHLWIEKGKVYLEGKLITEGVFHVITGLEETQEVAWSDEEAIDNGITPKKMVEGMTLKQKGKEW